MKKFKTLVLFATLGICLAACEKNTNDDLLSYTTSEAEGFQTLQIDDKVFVPFTLVTPADCGNQIGIAGNDSKDKIYEYKDFSSNEWIIEYYESGEMDVPMLYREQNVDDIPDGISSDYEWNNTSKNESCTSEYPMLIMVNDLVYKNTGYICSAVGCGTMDGTIDKTLDSKDTPTENNQSNFGTGYNYQYSTEGQIVVDIDGEKYIFRDSKLTDSSIPIEVANFTATIKEVRNDGQLLVTFVDVDDMFVSLADGDYVVDGSTLETDFSEGDSVRIWFDGSVEEVLPAILPNVYIIELL
ncbi:hypothetical protein [Pseudobutyrivibrio xylanivorans]|uniref:DUF3221 domain-containing protein n=1 Tax=Pseudobutyrivibrio xylanivorans TaxID=185007 RepID=A0A1G5S383_PSEXY|nr:hypothetical protein [Pseudobutyrivibrio xylanivorans]SCZ80824.1 hypothetical protein SAMN02910350_02494 [Pseudobutyrivibrio xylanivorans]